jgi:hypothetical protein
MSARVLSCARDVRVLANVDTAMSKSSSLSEEESMVVLETLFLVYRIVDRIESIVNVDVMGTESCTMGLDRCTVTSVLLRCRHIHMLLHKT